MNPTVTETAKCTSIVNIVQAQPTVSCPINHAYTYVTPPQHALESALERLRIAEALTARDNAVRQFEALCACNRSKDSAIAKLQREKVTLEEKLAKVTDAPDLVPASEPSEGSDREAVEDQFRKLKQENIDLQSKVDLLVQQYEENQRGDPILKHNVASANAVSSYLSYR